MSTRFGSFGERTTGRGYVLAYGIAAACLLAGLAYVVMSWIGALSTATATESAADLHRVVQDVGATLAVIGFALPVALLLAASASLAAIERDVGGLAGSAVRAIAPAFAGAPAVAIGIAALVALAVIGVRPSIAGGAAALAVLVIPTVTVRLMRVWRAVPRVQFEAAIAVGASDIGLIRGVLWPSKGRAFVHEAFLAAALLAGDAAAFVIASQVLAQRCVGCPMPIAARVLGTAVDVSPQAVAVESLVFAALVIAIYALGALVAGTSRATDV